MRGDSRLGLPGSPLFSENEDQQLTEAPQKQRDGACNNREWICPENWERETRSKTGFHQKDLKRDGSKIPKGKDRGSCLTSRIVSVHIKPNSNSPGMGQRYIVLGQVAALSTADIDLMV